MHSDPQTALSQQITGFYITFWRVPREIRMIPDTPLRLGILRFELRERRAVTYRYATNGLSWHVSGGETPYRSEFCVASRKQCPQAFSLLTSLCVYAAGIPEGVAPFATLPIAVANQTRAVGLLIAPPEPLDPEELGGMATEVAEPVLISRIVCLTAEELDFAIEAGGEALWEQRPGIQVRFLDDLM